MYPGMVSLDDTCPCCVIECQFPVDLGNWRTIPAPTAGLFSTQVFVRCPETRKSEGWLRFHSEECPGEGKNRAEWWGQYQGNSELRAKLRLPSGAFSWALKLGIERGLRSTPGEYWAAGVGGVGMGKPGPGGHWNEWCQGCGGVK